MAARKKDSYQAPKIAPPSATGNAGPQFEVKLGAFYVLSLLARSEPRGLSGAVVCAVELQRRVDSHPLDDVIVQAVNADGSPATLEIQAKRTLTFTTSDLEFRDVVGQMWEAAKKPEFQAQRYELAVAVARTTSRIEISCQETLQWARNVPDAPTFAAHIRRPGFASSGMRDFVEVFRANLAHVGAPTDDQTLWRMLRRFQILPFDFESVGSDYEHRARERARLVLAQDDAHRASTLWPILIDYVGTCGRSSGALTRDNVVTALNREHGFQFEARADLLAVEARLADEAERVLGEIYDEVGGVRLARFDLIDGVYKLLNDHRVLHIVGNGGCGKSAVLKQIARRLQPEGRILVLRNGRVPAGGWLSMSSRIGCNVSLDELFNELGCGGGATLFVDNIDQIEDTGEWATVSDLMTAVAKNSGWRAVVTGGVGNDEWKIKLPATAKTMPIATLEVLSLTDDEVELLSAENKTLGLILRSDHPAKDIARNLFYLSRLVELSANDAQAAAGIASELDLAKLWWRYGGGRAEDAGRLARLKVLRIVGTQVIAQPGRTAFNVDDLDSGTVGDLLRLDSLQEVTKGATVSFRHDVLRDWTIGFILHQNQTLLASLAMDQPISATVSRGLEIAARCALEADADGKSWLDFLTLTERDGCHGSWKRPILLALTRSEHALLHVNGLKLALLESSGRRLGELLRLMIAVESTPLAKALSRIQPSIAIPAGVDDLVVPKGLGWMWLVMWLVIEAESLPPELMPDVVRVFQAWLIWTQTHNADALNSKIVGLLFDWLAKIEERMTPRTFRRIEDAPPPLNIPHMREVRDRIQLSVFSFARHNPAAATRYLSKLTKQKPGYHDQQTILKAPGTLAMAAPKELADLVLATIIEKEDRHPWSSRRNRYGPFGVHDHLYSRASPSQGPFLDLLEHAPVEGLRLIRGLVEHATEWRRAMYHEERVPFPKLTIQFPEGNKSFEGDFSVYYWARSIAPSTVTASALMALEAWAHKQIEGGRPFAEALQDVLGPDGSSAAFLLVAVDLVLSHWPASRNAALPMVGTPELLVFDDIRHPRDLTGVDRLDLIDQGVENGRVKKADLETRPSRRLRLADTFGGYVFGGNSEQLNTLRTLLDQAHNEIRQGPISTEEDAVSGLRATAARALRMTFSEHWPIVKIIAEDGSEREMRQFQAETSELQLIAERQARSNESMRQMNIRLRLQHALLKPEKVSPEILREGIEWAKSQAAGNNPILATDDDDEDFHKRWGERAVVMAAAMAARDYEGEERNEIIDWARPILTTAARLSSQRFGGNDQIEYNATAIATIGLSSLYVRTQELWARDELLRLASHQHQAVIRALGRSFIEFDRADDRLVRALIRIATVSCIYFRRSDEDEANRLTQKAKIEAAIETERRWLAGELGESDWPNIPPWHLRRRRSFRLPGISINEVDDESEEVDTTAAFVDEHQLGELVGHLIRFTTGTVPNWLVPLTEHLMNWTLAANGPTKDQRWNSDNRPSGWNRDFFDFVGVLSVALQHADVVEIVHPITELNDDAFYDCVAAFLRGFDRATLATDTKIPENPAAMRRMIATRIKEGWNYRRFEDEKTFTSETHAGDALTAMFYQPPPFMNSGQTSLPANWAGLNETIETLAELAVGAPTSGYIAELFLNVIKTSPRGTLLPFVAAAATAWGRAYGTDIDFWSERDVGGRLCAWIDRTIDEDPTCASKIAEVRNALFKCLDGLVRAGVAQASDVEKRIIALLADRKTA